MSHDVSMTQALPESKCLSNICLKPIVRQIYDHISTENLSETSHTTGFRCEVVYIYLDSLLELPIRSLRPREPHLCRFLVFLDHFWWFLVFFLIIMDSVLEVIPYFIRQDPQLAIKILELDCQFLGILKTLLRRRREREEQPEEEAPPPKKRRYWVAPYLQKRDEQGQYATLMREFATQSPQKFKNFMRMDKNLFDELQQRVKPYIEKQTTNCREPIGVGIRLAITLRFLATGDSYKSLGYAFRVAPNTISKIVPETCRAIIAVLGDEVLKMPTTPEGWKQVAKGFEDRWNLPHCIGAIDGKHIRIRNPAKQGSRYFNYKKFFSIVMLAVVDSNYKFMYVESGAMGSESDAGIYAQTRLATMLQTNAANLPPAEPLPGEPTGTPVEYFLVGDDAFALRTFLMKPYPDRGLNQVERVFNYRLTRGRRVVENAFGILASR